jgi:hypothetical protein
MRATLPQILKHAFPQRRFTTFGETILAVDDGGAFPTAEEIEAARTTTEAALEQEAAEQQLASTRESMILTRAQFGEMLIRKGIKAQVIASLESIEAQQEREIMLEWFQHTPTVRRTSDKVESLRQKFGIPEATADQWFAEAMLYE